MIRVALAWFALTTVIFWLVTIRGAFDGPSYEWGLLGLGGRGMGGDYWFPLVAAAAALTIRAGGWRHRRWAFAAIAAWSVLLFVGVVVTAMSRPDDFRFRGDTLGIDLSLTWLGPVLFGGGAVGALVAAWRVLRRPEVAAAAWNARNWRWLAALAGVLPIQFLLLFFGGADGPLDPIGVIVTIAQWFMIDRVLQSYPSAETHPDQGLQPTALTP